MIAKATSGWPGKKQLQAVSPSTPASSQLGRVQNARAKKVRATRGPSRLHDDVSLVARLVVGGEFEMLDPAETACVVLR